jgi:RNA polymerase sigma factor (sigma-70 family)
MEPHKEVTGFETDVIRTVSANEADCRRVLAVAHARAIYRGIVGEEADDCAMAFLLHLLLRPHRPPGPAALFLSEAWLVRCADNWIRNAVRHRNYHRHIEVSWTTLNAEEQEGDNAGLFAGEDTPEDQTLRSELLHRLCGVVRQLTPSQRELFLRHFLAEESAVEIARKTGKRAGTVRQALLALRRHLQSLLHQAGMDEAETHEYLMLLHTKFRNRRL